MATAARTQTGGVQAEVRQLRRIVRARWRFVALVGVLVAGLLAGGVLDLSEDLGHLDARITSGQPGGAYSALVDDLAKVAAADEGAVANLSSAGSSDNVQRLAAARKQCDIEFGLAQDGARWEPGLRLIGRLGNPESVFFLGRNADALRRFEDLRGMTIGIGPEASGTAEVARSLLEAPDFAGLGLTLENYPLSEQLSALADGSLALGVFVIDQDSTFMRRAILELGLQIAGFEHADALARRHDFMSSGVVAAGEFDAVRVLPATSKPVLHIDTLVIGNGCAGRAETVAFLVALSRAHPGFIATNRARGGVNGIETQRVASDFFTNGGPSWAERHLPLLVDIMPPSNWVTIVMVISLAFNFMGGAHRFRLWRIDAARVRAEADLADVFGDGLTDAEIALLAVAPMHRATRTRLLLDKLIEDYDALRLRCREQSLSILVPMGQEMAYRYQEDIIATTLAALRSFRARMNPDAPGSRATQRRSSEEE